MVGVNTKPERTWLDRVREEDELLQRLTTETEKALRRRAEALKEGKDETGSVYQVAKLTGHTWPTVNNAIKKYTTT